jgi:DNA-binding NarL/FixJ family response regulator
LLKILMLENGTSDAELASSTFRGAGLVVKLERVGSRNEFVQSVKKLRPDLVLADGAVEGFGAINALAHLHDHRPGVPLIVFSRALTERQIVACLKAGAEDVILKKNVSHLPAAVESAIESRRVLMQLSPRQREVLRLIVDGHTNKDIGRKLRLSIKTVDTHRTAVMRRVGFHNLAHLVRFAVRVGLVPPERD